MNKSDYKINSTSVRLSNSQIDLLERVKNNNARINRTDLLMAGVNLLDILLSCNEKDEYTYSELINGLLIHDDLLRAIDRSFGSDVNEKRRKADTEDSLSENERLIIRLLKGLLSNYKSKPLSNKAPVTIE